MVLSGANRKGSHSSFTTPPACGVAFSPVGVAKFVRKVTVSPSLTVSVWPRLEATTPPLEAFATIGCLATKVPVDATVLKLVMKDR